MRPHFAFFCGGKDVSASRFTVDPGIGYLDEKEPAFRGYHVQSFLGGF